MADKTAAGSTLEIGARIQARVTQVLEGVILLEWHGLQGAVTIVDLTWSELERPATGDYAKVGDSLDVVVMHVADGRFSASVKHIDADADPWLNPPELGDRHEARILTTLDWGTWFALDDLQMAGVILGPPTHQPGDIVEVEIDVVDPTDRKLQAHLRR
jgi:ribosomal protein S1